MALQTKRIEVEVEARGIKIKGSPLTASIKSEINSKNVQVIGRGEEKMVATNTIGVSRDTFKAMVNSWENAVDQDGKVLKCTDKAKDDVFENDPDFVAEVVSKINQKVNHVRTGDLKN